MAGNEPSMKKAEEEVFQRANSSSLGPSEWQLPVESGHTHMHTHIPPAITLSKATTDIFFLSVSVRLLTSSPGAGSQRRFPPVFHSAEILEAAQEIRLLYKVYTGWKKSPHPGWKRVLLCVQLHFFWQVERGDCQWLLLEKKHRSKIFFFKWIRENNVSVSHPYKLENPQLS